MKQRLIFVTSLFVLTSALGWWAQSIQGVSTSNSFALEMTSDKDSLAQSSRGIQDASLRRDLLEVLDHLVAYELYYRSVYGRFTKILNRVGVTIPHSVAQAYEIHVMEASADHLLVTAFSEVEGRIVDQLSMNQNYDVHANFKLPLPRSDYLRSHATKHLRLLRETTAASGVEEQGVYKDYFRYEVRSDSQDRRVAFAVGIRPPVVGMQLEYGPTQAADFANNEDPNLPLGLDLADLPEAGAVASLGQGAGSDVMTTGEEAQLAQKIYRGEVGRYAKTLSELSKIANFQFSASTEIAKKKDKNDQEADRQISSFSGDLEIEPIDSSSKN